jgi:hypothetical protein
MIADREQAEPLIRAMFDEYRAQLGLKASLRVLDIQWRAGAADVQAQAFDGLGITISIGDCAGIVRIAATLAHELAHLQGHFHHRLGWRVAYCRVAWQLWGVDAHNAARVSYHHDLDSVVEYRLWRAEVLAEHPLVAVVGNPEIPVPTYRIEIRAPLRTILLECAPAGFRQWLAGDGKPRGHIRVSADAGHYLGCGMLYLHAIVPKGAWSPLDRLATRLRTLPREV